MMANSNFDALEDQLRTTTERVEPLKLAEKNRLRPTYAPTPFQWQRLAAPLGMCAAGLMAIMVFTAIWPTVAPQEATNPTPSVASVVQVMPTEPATPTPSPMPTESSVMALSEAAAAALAIEAVRELEQFTQRQIVVNSAEIISPTHLHFSDQSAPAPTLPDRFWAINVERSDGQQTDQCTVLTRASYQDAQSPVLGVSCHQLIGQVEYVDDNVQTFRPDVIMQSDPTLTESHTQVSKIRVTPSSREGYSDVEVVVQFEHAAADGLLVLHWDYFYWKSRLDRRDGMGDLVIKVGHGRGAATFQFEVSDRLIDDGSLENLFLSPALRSVGSDTLAAKRILYVVPDNLQPRQQGLSAEALTNLGINVETVHHWQDAMQAHAAEPVDILLIHHRYAQFRPTPSLTFLDRETVLQLEADGVTLVGIGVSYLGLRTQSERDFRPNDSHLFYALGTENGQETLNHTQPFLLSNGWSTLIDELETIFADE